MRIRIGSYWLAGDPSKAEHEHSSALMQSAPERLQQVITGARWVSKQHVDRGNVSSSITFETTRRFASIAAADAFMFSTIFSAAHPWSGTVSVRSSDLTTWVEYDIPNAVIQMPVMIPMGVTLRLRYTILGGVPVAGITSSTTTAQDITTEDGSAIETEDAAHLQKEH